MPSPTPQDGPETVAVRRALLSVSDKTGIVDFARALAGHGVEIVSTGGTARALREAGLSPREVSDLTGFPEILDGRVKTLHPRVHGGILGRRDDLGHRAALEAHGIAPIDLVAVNLYPFEAAARAGGDETHVIEEIDVGGPAMIRAAAKNQAHVAVVTDPADYGAVLAAIAAGGVPRALRRRLAAKAFRRTAAYDAAIAAWWAERSGEGFPDPLLLTGRLAARLRYGENPHQDAALYLLGEERPGAARGRLVQGKPLSYNNIADADAAFELAAEFDPGAGAAVVIVKHANPCGVGIAPTLEQAHAKALRCDPVSAFGGVVAANAVLDAEAARAIAALFTEVVVAPDADEEALASFSTKPQLRLLLTGALPEAGAPGRLVRSVAGGLLVQSRDAGRVDRAACRTVTRRTPTESQWADLLFAMSVAKHVRSNAIVYARDGATVGIGAGQMSRVDAARIAALKAAEAARAAGCDAPLTRGSVVASDAFFPFADGLLAAAEAGATAAIQPGGSVRDEEVIAAADEAGLAMVFTGMRHFRH